MSQFYTGQSLYQLVQKQSSGCRDVLWVASPYLGSRSHEILSKRILKNPPRDLKFVFGLTEAAVRSGSVDPYEIDYLQSHFGPTCIRTNNAFHAKLYIFDKAAIVTSANLSRKAFERNIEVGALFENGEVKKIKDLYAKLWKKSSRLRDLDNYKNVWNRSRHHKKRDESAGPRWIAGKRYTRIEPWDEKTSHWIVPITHALRRDDASKIRKATHWIGDYVADLRRETFRNMKLGDLVFLADNLTRRMNVVRVRGKRQVRIRRGRPYCFDHEKLKGTRTIGISRIADSLKRMDLLSRNNKVECERKLTDKEFYRLMKLTRSAKRPRS